MGEEIITQTISNTTAKFVKAMMLFKDFENTLEDATHDLYGGELGSEIIHNHMPDIMKIEDVVRKLLTDSIIENINDKAKNQF
jgi:hypothetical protein